MGKKLSLGEELRATSLAAYNSQKEGAAARERAAKKDELERKEGVYAWATSYLTDTLLPELRIRAEKGEEYYSKELSHGNDFVKALLQLLVANGLEASAQYEDCEDPNTEIPRRYQAYVIRVKIR